MGFGYAGTSLVIFLTHPGVIIPTISSITSAVPLDLLPPQYGELIPKEGFPPPLSALWQVMWTWILTAGEKTSEGGSWTLFILYCVFLFLYMYFGALGMRLAAGI